MVKATGGLPFTTGPVPDVLEALVEAFESNLGHADLFVCTGGASAGVRDLLAEAIGQLGEVAAVKVAMRPGMPQVRGRIGSTPVIGLPGNPVSSFVSFEVFVRPALRALQGRRDVHRPTVIARVAEPLHAPPHKRGYVRVRLAREGAGWSARPTGAQGSHIVSSIAQADGLAIVPEAVTEIRVGDEVRVMLLVD
jgi:molybdopterin molybdotransferase